MKQILCYGDSNTWGLIPGTTERYPWGVRWTSILQERLQDRDIRVIEEGLCGRTIANDDRTRPNRNSLRILPTMLEAHAPLDAAILLMGTNDCKYYFSLDPVQIAEDLGRCVDLLLQKLPAERILLVSPIHLGKLVWKEEYDPEFNSCSVVVSEKLRDEFRKIAEQKKVRFLAASDYATPSPVDQEHMDASGHAALAEAIYGVVSEMDL